MIDYLVYSLGTMIAAYQAGFYGVLPQGFAPYIAAKFDLDMPSL